MVSIDESQANRRLKRVILIIVSITKELFCDLVGIRLMGPAFLFSLYELSWGQDKSIWATVLSPDDNQTRAYPSFHFRLGCLFRFGKIDEFCDNAQRDFATVGCALKDTLPDCLRTITKDHSSDKLGVWPRDDIDKSVIEKVLGDNFGSMKTAIEAYLDEADKLIALWYASILPKIDTMEIAHLLLRFQHKIPPNIIPSTTLLGQPANFQAVLNASALYRTYLLANSNFVDLAQQMGVVERLTAKSFEVTYIQQKFNIWERRNG